MDEKKLNLTLYEKMSAEQERFRQGLLGQTPGEILGLAYEYAMREQILTAMKTLELPAKEAEALLLSSAPLADVYMDFQDFNLSLMDTIRSCIRERADTLLGVKQKRRLSCPLYQQSGICAREHGELDLYRASRQANVACKDAIEAAIRFNFDGMHLAPAAVKYVLEKFGPERVAYVLAATIQDRPYDQRFSNDSRTWAESVPMYEAADRRGSYIIDTHSTPLELFVRQARQEMEAAKEQPEKDSIKARLAVKSPQTVDSAGRTKGQERADGY